MGRHAQPAESTLTRYYLTDEIVQIWEEIKDRKDEDKMLYLMMYYEVIENGNGRHSDRYLSEVIDIIEFLIEIEQIMESSKHAN